MPQKRSVLLVWTWVMLVVLLAADAWAQQPRSAAPPATGAGFAEIFEKGGVLMYPLAAMSILGLALIIYYAFALREEQITPGLLRRELLQRIRAGQLDDARAACSDRPSPLGEITLVALDHVASAPRIDPSLLKDIMEGEGSRQAAGIQGQTQYIVDVAVISPMIGLLGTVFGMIRAFNVVAFDLAKAKPQLLANGVAEALITTAAGLIIGIPAMMFYAYFRGRASLLVSRLESASSEIMNALVQARAK